MRRVDVSLASLLLLLPLGCVSEEVRSPPEVVFAEFDPAASPPVGPTPNDLARDPRTGAVRFPLGPDPSDAERALADYFAALDAYPPMLTAEASFSAPIDPATATGRNVIVLDLTRRLVVEGASFVVDPSGRRLTIVPPGGVWPSGHGIAVAVIGGEDGLRGAKGEPVVGTPALFFSRSVRPISNCTEPGPECSSFTPLLSVEQAVGLERLRRALAPLFEAYEALGIARDRIALLWSFTLSARPFAAFDPKAGRIPFPHDLLLDAQAGRVALPILPTDPPDVAQLKSQANELAGFSTTARVTAEFVLPPGRALAPPVPGAVTTTMPAVEIEAAGDTLVLRPTHPLAERTTYLVAVTRALTAGGAPVEPSPLMVLLRQREPLTADGKSTIRGVLSDEEAARLEPARARLVAAFDAAGIPPEEVVLGWTFTTQPTVSVLEELVASSPDPSPTSVEAPLPPQVPQTHLGGLRTGTLVGSAGEPIRYLLALPRGTPAGLVLFQHGLGSDKTAMFAVADAFAEAGLATAAIDLPLHGERAEPGRELLELPDVLRVRDALLEGAADLAQLSRAATGPGLGGIVFAEPAVVGVSFGGLVAADMAAVRATPSAPIVLSTTGAPIVDIFLESPALQPLLAEMLGGLQFATPQFERFVDFARWILDAADPIHYAARLRPLPVLVQVGGNDPVIPPARGRALAEAAGAELQVVAGAGHAALLDPSAAQFELFVGRAIEFIVGGNP